MRGRRVYRDYVQATNNYLIPFFGTHHVDHITYPLIQAFAAWRIAKMGKEPKASTINTYNSALNRIFDEALMRGLHCEDATPDIGKTGVVTLKGDLILPSTSIEGFIVPYANGFTRAGQVSQATCGSCCATMY